MTAKKGKSRKARRPLLAKVKISKPLSWLGKYLLRVARQMPTMVMPRRIRSFQPHPKKEHRTLGSCSIHDRTINLATHSIIEKTVKGRRRRVLVRLPRLAILQTFAHELSHLAYETHGYEQEWYGRTIFNTFGLTETCPTCGGKGRVPAPYENE